MKHRASLLCVLACALCLALGLAGCSKPQGYQPETKSPAVSSPAIGVDGTLRVGIESDESAPFTMSSSEGVDGLDVEIAAALADEMGLALEVVNVGAEGSAALTGGEVDILMSASPDDGTSMWVSEPYISTGIALFGNADASVPTRDSAPRVAAQSSSTSAWAVTTAFGDDALVPNGNLNSAFSSIEADKAEYVAADAVIGTYASFSQNVEAQPIALFGQPSGYCIGVAAENADLQQAVSAALEAIVNGGIVNIISEKWIGKVLDLSALPVIETAQKEATSAPQGDTDGSDGSDAETVNEGPEAGSNAVVPSGV